MQTDGGSSNASQDDLDHARPQKQRKPGSCRKVGKVRLFACGCMLQGSKSRGFFSAECDKMKKRRGSSRLPMPHFRRERSSSIRMHAKG
ncbi:hypothetical protein IG631_22806 [Alternaria alternata]|nr:hypothetical protein IG631_22806 [Alternaria alternata]